MNLYHWGLDDAANNGTLLPLLDRPYSKTGKTSTADRGLLQRNQIPQSEREGHAPIPSSFLSTLPDFEGHSDAVRLLGSAFTRADMGSWARAKSGPARVAHAGPPGLRRGGINREWRLQPTAAGWLLHCLVKAWKSRAWHRRKRRVHLKTPGKRQLA